jgi:hypothetical protein
MAAEPAGDVAAARSPAPAAAGDRPQRLLLPGLVPPAPAGCFVGVLLLLPLPKPALGSSTGLDRKRVLAAVALLTPACCAGRLPAAAAAPAPAVL